MKQALAAVLALALLAAAPPPGLVAGTVRDQDGRPVGGARITILKNGIVTGTALTASDGTFVVDGTGVEAEVRCAYCRPVRVPIDGEGLATAIVVRYDALLFEGPSRADLEHLPFAPPATLLALAPFVVVNETSRTVPGLSATDRNATPYGGLLVLDGAPDYDVTAGVTPFDTVPQGAASRVSVLRVDEAYRYGNVAQGGTFAVDTSGGASHAGSGDNSLLRVGAGGDSAGAALSYADAQTGLRAQRAAAALAFDMPRAEAGLRLSSGSGYASPNTGSPLFSSFSSAVAEIRSRSAIDSFARVTADRGTYDYTSLRFPESSTWSDTQLEAGVDSHAVVAPFAHFGVRESSGAYLSKATGSDAIGGVLSQARVTAGVGYRSERLDAFVAGGNTWIGYRGIGGSASADGESANDGVASFTFRPAAHWSIHASASSGYTLQTLTGLYAAGTPGYPYVPPFVSGHTNEGVVEYSDGSRIRASATALSWSGTTGSATSSAGASIAWQIAPDLSMRTWLLHQSSTGWAPSTVGTTWLSYEHGPAFRADLIWGRSLLDRSPAGHLQGAISGRLTERIEWFVSSAFVAGAQAQSAGLLFHKI